MTRCPQCDSLYCGNVSCRFSGMQHIHAASEARNNAYANFIVKRDQEVPLWEQKARTGARDE